MWVSYNVQIFEMTPCDPRVSWIPNKPLWVGEPLADNPSVFISTLTFIQKAARRTIKSIKLAICLKHRLTRNVGQCPTWWSPCRKVWLTPTTRRRAVTLPRRETSWNLQRYPKLVNRSQPLVGRSSLYCGDMWRTYCCLTSFFFRLSIRALVAKI